MTGARHGIDESGAEAALSPRFFGQRVRRREDFRFLTGSARFVDDVVLHRMLFASFARSTEAHARILGVDLDAALAHRGVRAGLSAVMLAGRARPIRCDSTLPNWQSSGCPILATDKVRFVGEAVACLAADDRAGAEDAAALVAVDYEPLPVLVNAAAADGGPLVHEDWGDNYFIRRHFETEGFEEVMAAAPRRLARTYTMARHSGVPIEPRGCIAEWDEGRSFLTLAACWSAPMPASLTSMRSSRSPLAGKATTSTVS